VSLISAGSNYFVGGSGTGDPPMPNSCVGGGNGTGDPPMPNSWVGGGSGTGDPPMPNSWVGGGSGTGDPPMPATLRRIDTLLNTTNTASANDKT